MRKCIVVSDPMAYSVALHLAAKSRKISREMARYTLRANSRRSAPPAALIHVARRGAVGDKVTPRAMCDVAPI